MLWVKAAFCIETFFERSISHISIFIHNHGLGKYHETWKQKTWLSYLLRGGLNGSLSASPCLRLQPLFQPHSTSGSCEQLVSGGWNETACVHCKLASVPGGLFMGTPYRHNKVPQTRQATKWAADGKWPHPHCRPSHFPTCGAVFTQVWPGVQWICLLRVRHKLFSELKTIEMENIVTLSLLLLYLHILLILNLLKYFSFKTETLEFRFVQACVILGGS